MRSIVIERGNCARFALTIDGCGNHDAIPNAESALIKTY